MEWRNEAWGWIDVCLLGSSVGPDGWQDDILWVGAEVAHETWGGDTDDEYFAIPWTREGRERF